MIKVPLLRHQRYISPLQLTSRVKSNDKTYLKKKCWLWHLRWTCYGQFYWTKLSGYHIHTKYCKFDHSEMIFGPFEKMTFLGEHPLSQELLLAGGFSSELLQNHRNSPEILFPPKIFAQNYRDFWFRPQDNGWSGLGIYHGLWWTDALDPAYRRDPDTIGDAAMCWVKRVPPPQPEQIHADGTLFLVRFVCTIILE